MLTTKPYRPELGTQDTFQWTDELVQEFVQFTLHKSPAFQGRYTDMEQFKSSKSPKKEWGVVAYRTTNESGENPRYWDLVDGGLYKVRDDNNTSKLGPDHFTDGNIFSVRRLSDGIIFSCQEKVRTPYAGDLVIYSFEIRGQEMIARFTNGHLSNGYCNINGLSKLPQPILVTSDGVEITEPTALHIVSENWNICEIVKVNIKKQLDFDHRGVFSTREAAEEYILNNRPLLSLNDVKENIGDNRNPSRAYLMHQLTTLVKQKLNQ